MRCTPDCPGVLPFDPPSQLIELSGVVLLQEQSHCLTQEFPVPTDHRQCCVQVDRWHITEHLIRIQEPFDRVLEFFRAHRFGDVAVHARGQTFLPVLLHGVGSHGEDRDVSVDRHFPLSDTPCGLQAIHLRHLYVHQDQIQALLLYQPEHLQAVTCYQHRMAHLLQGLSANQLTREVVIGQQNAQP